MKKQEFFILLFCALFSGIIRCNEPNDWTVYIFFAAEGDLETHAQRNYELLLNELDLLREKLPGIRVCVERYADNKTIRFTFDDGKIEQTLHEYGYPVDVNSRSQKACVERGKSDSHRMQSDTHKVHSDNLRVQADNPEVQSDNHFEEIQPISQALSAGLSWTFSKPTAHSMVILSGHGSGILGPFFANSSSSVPLSDLALILEQVSNIGIGKKIDILGFDACYMAMLEVAVQFSSVADYLIASQGKEPLQGWDYKELVTTLAYGSNCKKDKQYSLANALMPSFKRDPLSLVRTILVSYAALQRSYSRHHYTLSALDLYVLDAVIENLQKVISSIDSYSSTFSDNDFIEALYKVRSRNAHFYGAPHYADLITFYQELLEELSVFFENEQCAILKKSLIEGLTYLEQMVVCSCAGKASKNAKGCSLCFPTQSCILELGKSELGKSFLAFQGISAIR